jgi:flagellar assembly protein FliH
MTQSKPPRGVLRNVPPPAGGGKPASAYARFIPREELGAFAAWQPGALGDGGAPAAPGRPATPPPAPATERGDAAVPGRDDRDSRDDRAAAADHRGELAAARQGGYEDGYRDGMAALESFKQTFASQATAQVGALIQAFDQQFQALDQRLSDALARCAVELARQVLRHELRTHPELVAKVAAEAVAALMNGGRHVTVQVHPADLPLVAEGAGEALAARGAKLLASTAIDRGGVLIECELGAIDARIGARWAQAAGAFGSKQPWAAPTGFGRLDGVDADSDEDDA